MMHGSNDLEYLIDTLYGDRRGYAELSTIEGDPDSKAYVYHQGFFTYAPWHKPALMARISELAALHGNVYLSLTLYSKPDSGKQHALPGNVIVFDDAAPGDYTFTVQTSPNSMHAYRTLDRTVDTATRENLARREAYATGADHACWNVNRVVRVPGTFNTKAKHVRANGGEWYPVTLQAGSGRTFTPDELEQRFPPAPTPAHVSIGDMTAEWERAQYWIDHIQDLLTEGRPRKWTNPNAPGRRILAGNLVPIQKSTGQPDTSEMRYIGVKSLVLYGYRDEKIRAIAWHLFSYDAEQYKGSAWLRADIDRCVSKARSDCAAQGYTIRLDDPYTPFSRPVTPATPLPIVQGSRARKDRPQKLTAAMYLAWCHERMNAAQQVTYTRPEAATVHGVSVGTIDRLERKLRGQIERYTAPDRRHSWLVVYVKPQAQNMMIVPSAPALETAPNIALEVLSTSYALKERTPVGEEHSRTFPPAPPGGSIRRGPPRGIALQAERHTQRERPCEVAGPRGTIQGIGASGASHTGATGGPGTGAIRGPFTARHGDAPAIAARR